MAVRWFRISFARNAFLRCLDTEGLDLDRLSTMRGVSAMEQFVSGFRPQHAEHDDMACAWGPVDDGWEFVIERRMQRHGHPESTLSLVFGYTASEQRSSRGRATVATLRDVKQCEGYTLTRGSRPRYRRLVQS